MIVSEEKVAKINDDLMYRSSDLPPPPSLLRKINEIMRCF
jgi:hypothetical protein